MGRALIDTNVFVHALGREHPLREPSREVIRLLEAGRIEGEVNAVILAELMHQRVRQTGDRAEAARLAEAAGALCEVHRLERADTQLAQEWFAATEGLRSFDALLAAAAANRGLDAVISADTAFDRTRAPRRVDPRDAEGLAALAA